MKNKEYILVTGASGKLGKTICKIFAEKNENIIFHYFNSNQNVDLLIEEFKKKYNQISLEKIRIDLSNLYSVHYFYEKIFKNYQIKGLVNNASIYIKDSKKNNDKFFHKNMNIHFRNPVSLISCLINSCAKEKFVINITDNNLTEPYYQSYNKSKLLLSEFSQSIEGRHKEISIKELKPGKVLPSKNIRRSLSIFKQEFNKLIE